MFMFRCVFSGTLAGDLGHPPPCAEIFIPLPRIVYGPCPIQVRAAAPAAFGGRRAGA